MPGLLSGGPTVQGIQDNKWKWAFFAGALCTVTAGVIAIIGLLAKGFNFAPGAFVSDTYLLIFGLVMVALDWPFKDNSVNKSGLLSSVRNHTYKFMLFLTRFTGRGIWYLSLSTIIFVALFDDNTCTWLGVLLCLIVFLISVAALCQGLMLSAKLKAVQEGAVNRPFQDFMPEGQLDLNKQQFQQMISSTMHQQNTFKPEEIDYIINALSFTAKNDGKVSREELMYWLHPGGNGWIMV